MAGAVKINLLEDRLTSKNKQADAGRQAGSTHRNAAVTSSQSDQNVAFQGPRRNSRCAEERHETKRGVGFWGHGLREKEACGESNGRCGLFS